MADDGAIVVYRGLNNQSEGIIHHLDSRSDNMAMSATVTAPTFAVLHRMGEGLIKRLVISSVFKFRTKLHLRCTKSHPINLMLVSNSVCHRLSLLSFSTCLFSLELLMASKSLKSPNILGSLFPLMS